MTDSRFPEGWDEDRVRRVLDQYEQQAAEEAGVNGRPEYDFSGGIRGKYAERYAEGTELSVLDPELAGEEAVIATLHRFGSLLAAQDAAIIHEFAPDADALFVGSEADEVASGPDQIAEFFRALLAQPVTIVFEWRETRASVAGEQAWLFAAGDAAVRTEDSQRRMPYRLTGVFQRRGGKWLWKHFHGSEPSR